MSQDIPISERTLGELLPERLTWSLCIHIDKGTEVWVVTGMLVQYLESFTDSVMVRDDTKPIGVVGGREIIHGVYKNSYTGLVQGIMKILLLTHDFPYPPDEVADYVS